MTLSSRAIAFSVDNLLHSPTSSHSSEAPIPDRDRPEKVDACQEFVGRIQQEHTLEAVSPCHSPPENDGHSKTVDNDSFITERVSLTSNVKAPPEPSEDRVTSCFCHGEMSFCMHPGVMNVTDRHGSGTAISAELLHSDLWFKFHRLGTEMIITKSGRRMFPSLKLRVNGLDPGKTYQTRLEFVQPDCKKYRYIYHSSRWMVSGSGDALSSTPSHLSPECPLTGQVICSQVLSFERLKLTNSEHSKPGQVSLVSMQKFQPQVVIEEVEVNGRSQETTECYQIVFPQTSFMAVTAYQNQQITTLKIASNPFAKGFRDSGKLRYPYDGKGFNQPHSPGTHLRLAGYDTSSRLFPAQGHSILESMESRFGRKRSHLHPWELESREKSAKAMRFDIFNSPPSLPLLLHPQFSLSPYLSPGYPPCPPEHTIPQTILRHDLSSFRYNAMMSGENDLPLPNSFPSLSSPSSSLSSSSSSLPSSSYSPLTLGGSQTSPPICQIHKKHNDTDLLPLRHCSSTSSLNSTSSSTFSGNYLERIMHSSEAKQDLQCDRHSPCYVDFQRDNNNNPLYPNKNTSNKSSHQIPHLENNLSEANGIKPLMPINNITELQHDNDNDTSRAKSETKTLLSHPSCRNGTACKSVYPSVSDLNESLKLIPYLYRHPFGVHGQCQTGQVFGHP